MFLGDADEAGLDSEQVYLAACCTAGVWEPQLHGVDRSMFVANVRAFDLVEQYVSAHGEPPPVELLTRQFPGFEVIPGVNPVWAAGNVMKAAQRRALLQVAGDAVELLSGDADPLAAAQILAGAADVVPQTVTSVGTPISDTSLFVPPDYTGRIPVPDAHLQALTHGIGQGDYWVIAARLKQGKTWMLMRFAVEAMKAGLDVVFMSLEMTKMQAAERLHTLMLRSWTTPADPYERQEAVEHWLAKYGASLLLVDRSDHPMVTPATVGRYCTADRLVIVDYIGLMTPSSAGGKDAADWAVMQSISRELRRVTLSTGGALLTAAQLNRQAGKSPDVIHIAETDSIARDADVVLIMNRPYNAPVTRMTVGANRHGPSGDSWYTKFLPEIPDFGDITAHEADNKIQAAKQEANR